MIEVVVDSRRLLVTYPLDPVNRSKLAAALNGWAIRYQGRSPSKRDLRWAEVVFGNVVPSTMLVEAPQLKWLHSPSAGVEAYDAVRGRVSAQITNVVGLCNDAVAEHGILFILMALRDAPRMLRAQHQREWIQTEVYANPPRLLAGASVHVLGYGGIARCLIGKLQALGAFVTAYRRDVTDTGSTQQDEVRSIAVLPETVGEADVLVSLLPGGEETQCLVGHSVLSRMRADTIFVNLGRGSTVDEPALEKALRSGGLRGAALDVFAAEPLPATSPLWNFDNAIISPHIAGRFVGHIELQCAEFVRMVSRFVR